MSATRVEHDSLGPVNVRRSFGGRESTGVTDMKTEQKPLNSGFGAETTAEEIAAGIDLRGKVCVITGGHSGIGVETTRVLTGAGAFVCVGARDMAKARNNLAKTNNVELIDLDLADPESVDRFAEQVINAHNVIHLLINNAGIMRPPTLMRNARGYELQFATNHLGHFQLTARLWPAVKNAPGARVVTLSSIGHRYSGVDLDDPNYLSRPYVRPRPTGSRRPRIHCSALSLIVAARGTACARLRSIREAFLPTSSAI